MNKHWLILIAISVIASGMIMFIEQPVVSESVKENLLTESIALQDQLSRQQRLSILLSDSIALDDHIATEVPSQ